MTGIEEIEGIGPAFGAKLNQLAQNPAGAIQLVQGAIEDEHAGPAWLRAVAFGTRAGGQRTDSGRQGF